MDVGANEAAADQKIKIGRLKQKNIEEKMRQNAMKEVKNILQEN